MWSLRAERTHSLLFRMQAFSRFMRFTKTAALRSITARESRSVRARVSSSLSHTSMQKSETQNFIAKCWAQASRAMPITLPLRDRTDCARLRQSTAQSKIPASQKQTSDMSTDTERARQRTTMLRFFLSTPSLTKKIPKSAQVPQKS